MICGKDFKYSFCRKSCFQWIHLRRLPKVIFFLDSNSISYLLTMNNFEKKN